MSQDVGMTNFGMSGAQGKEASQNEIIANTDASDNLMEVMNAVIDLWFHDQHKEVEKYIPPTVTEEYAPSPNFHYLKQFLFSGCFSEQQLDQLSKKINGLTIELKRRILEAKLNMLLANGTTVKRIEEWQDQQYKTRIQKAQGMVMGQQATLQPSRLVLNPQLLTSPTKSSP